MSLPTCVSIKPTVLIKDNFLYLGAQNATSKEGIVTFGEILPDTVLTSSTNTRFYLDPSKEMDDKHAQLRHIRCAYNNKYLMPIAQGDSGRIMATGTTDEPEEDLSKASCTLFKLTIEGSSYDESIRSTVYRVRFTHPMNGKDVGIFSRYGDSEPTISSLHRLYDVGEQIILPPYVAIKGDNDLYLRAEEFNGSTYFQFAESGIENSSVFFTTYNYAQGTVRIKSKAHNKFLRLSSGWIMLGDSKEKDGTEELFKVFGFGDHFALQSIHDGHFCVRSTGDCIGAGTDEIFTKKARLQFEEPIFTREIYNIQYHVRHQHRIYDSTTMNMATASAINRTNKENTIKSSVTITRKETSKLESTQFHKASVKASVTSAVIPIVLSGSLEFGYEFTKGAIWGTTEETEKKQGIEYQVTVPANKKVTLSVTATQAKYDVPFSYTQKDKMHNGEVRIENFDDGLFSGMNSFDLRYETKEEEVDPIPISKPVIVSP